MSSVSASSKFIEIQDNNMGGVVLKNIKAGPTSTALPILFKVKTNLKDKVDVRPSFGVLLPNSIYRSAVNLVIKYSGELQQIEKAKLMVSWIAIQNKKELEEKIPHQEFTEIFSKANKIGQGSLILPFKLKENAEKDRFQANKSENISSIIEKSSEIFPPIADEKKIQKEKQNQNQHSESIKQPREYIQQRQIKIEQPIMITEVSQNGVRFSLATLLFVFILAFGLGFYLGLKIQEVNRHLNLSPSKAIQSIVTSTEQPLVEKQPQIQTNTEIQNNEGETKAQNTQQTIEQHKEEKQQQQSNSGSNQQQQNLDI